MGLSPQQRNRRVRNLCLIDGTVFGVLLCEIGTKFGRNKPFCVHRLTHSLTTATQTEEALRLYFTHSTTCGKNILLHPQPCVATTFVFRKEGAEEIEPINRSKGTRVRLKGKTS
eukprot:scaffold2510_cov169-Amphora_coffeaeformis.AAC.16